MTAPTHAPTMSNGKTASVASDLQQQLSELLVLSLAAKHAHWNVVGPEFRAIHLQLDEITADLRLWSDTVAERIVTLGVPARGQADALPNAHIPPLPNNQWLPDKEVITAFAERLTTAAHQANERAQPMGDTDLASQAILIDVIQGMEKHGWMLRAALGGTR